MSGILCLSCNDWLDVSPSTEKDKEDILSNQAGFRSALIGAYIRMKSSGLYGKEMTWGVVENLAQHWDFEKNSVGEFLNKYDYKAALVESTMATLYNNLYKVIADVNSILEVIDKEKGVFAPGEYELIKGEATAIRAFCHFDVLRLFGPIPGKLPSGKVLPYVTTVSLVPNQHRTYEEYTRMLVADLDTAERNLGKVDLIRKYSIQELNQSVPQTYGADDVFWGYRQMRMNYYAVLAEKARVYLWLQDKSKALEYATKVIGADYHFTTQEEMNAMGVTLCYSEIISGIYLKNTLLKKQTEKWFSENAGSTKLKISSAGVETLFEVASLGSTDLRKKNQFGSRENENEVFLNKYFTGSLLPLIRLSEVYYIAAECAEEPETRFGYLNEVRRHRFIPILDSRDPQIDLENEIYLNSATL